MGLALLPVSTLSHNAALDDKQWVRNSRSRMLGLCHTAFELQLLGERIFILQHCVPKAKVSLQSTGCGIFGHSPKLRVSTNEMYLGFLFCTKRTC
jgi:hypothetical protein